MSSYEPWKTFVAEVNAAGELVVGVAAAGKKLVITGLAVSGQGFDKWRIKTGNVALMSWDGGTPLVLPVNDPLYGGTGWMATGDGGDLTLSVSGSGNLSVLILYREMDVGIGV